MNILLINQGKSNENLGDKSIAITLKKLLENKGAKVTVAGYTQMEETEIPETSQLINEKKKKIATLKNSLKRKIPHEIVYQLKYKKKINQEFDSLSSHDQNYDIAIIGGGQLIKTKSVFPYAFNQWVNLINTNLKIPVYTLGVGLDTKFSNREIKILKKALRKIDLAYVRDRSSMETLNKLDEKLKVNYSPDVVLGSYENKINKNRKRFLVNIFSKESYNNNNNLSLSENEYYKLWIDIIKKEKKDLKLTLAYTTTTDKIETLKFSRYLEKNTNYEFEYVESDTLDEYHKLLNEVDTILTGRMHGLLIAINHGCKPIPFIVNKKLETFNNEWIINKNNVDYHMASNKIDRVLSDIIK